MVMDWFSWLAKTSLEPSSVHEYGLVFAHNELQKEDVPHFTHEFLQSMGISIAKHRQEILKLARKEEGTGLDPMKRALIAIKRTKRCLSKYMSTWMHKQESSTSALVLIPRPNGYWSRWRSIMLERNKKKFMTKNGKQERLMLANGKSMLVSSPRLDSFSSPLVFCKTPRKEEKMDGDDLVGGGNWPCGVGDHIIRWDAMFQNLKPT